MLRSILIITSLIILTSGSYAQTKINSLEISGNKYFTYSDIFSTLVTKKDGNFSSEQFRTDLKTIRDKYKSAGFLFAKISEDQLFFAEDSSYVDIRIKIEEGNKVPIGDIEISGGISISKDKILQMFETKVGENLDDNILNSDIKELLLAYEKIGLPFAKVNVQDISVYKDGSDNKLKIKLTRFWMCGFRNVWDPFNLMIRFWPSF